MLEGAPALVMAVPRRAQVSLSPREGTLSRLDSRAGQQLIGHCRLGAHAGVPGGLAWEGDDPQWLAQVDLVDAVLRWRIIDAPQWPSAALNMHLDTRAFFDHTTAAGGKLGLGSSAALTVAFAAALTEYAAESTARADRATLLAQLLALHRAFQGGHGSGLDIATSLCGGLISFQAMADGPGGPAAPVVSPQTLPADVHMLGVWSGNSASTPQFLQRLAGWRTQAPVEYETIMGQLRSLSIAAQAAIVSGSSVKFVQSVRAFGAGLAELGSASGLGIFSTQHRQIAARVTSDEVVYKPCGAGGGDLGIAVSRDPQALAHVRQAVIEAGFAPMELRVDPIGLELKTSLE